jgi:hypothetical protein
VIIIGMMLTAVNAQSKKFENRSSGQVEGVMPVNQSSQAAADDRPRDRIEGTRRANPAQAAASTPTNQSPEARTDDEPRDRIEGTWRVSPEIFSDLKGLLTFGAGRDANQGIVVSSINFSFAGPFSCLNGQGTWKRTGDRSFIGTDEAFCFDSSNSSFNPAGKVKLRYELKLNKAGTQFDGTAQAELSDTFGNVFESFGGPLHAVRMQAEAPTP